MPAGEVVYRVACPKKRYGATGGGNCSELLPVKELSPLGKLEGEQLYILPQTRYTILSLSSSFRAQRIREGEQDLQAARMIRAQERVRSAISATSLPLQDGESGGNEGTTGF